MCLQYDLTAGPCSTLWYGEPVLGDVERLLLGIPGRPFECPTVFHNRTDTLPGVYPCGPCEVKSDTERQPCTAPEGDDVELHWAGLPLVDTEGQISVLVGSGDRSTGQPSGVYAVVQQDDTPCRSGFDGLLEVAGMGVLSTYGPLCAVGGYGFRECTGAGVSTLYGTSSACVPGTTYKIQSVAYGRAATATCVDGTLHVTAPGRGFYDMEEVVMTPDTSDATQLTGRCRVTSTLFQPWNGTSVLLTSNTDVVNVTSLLRLFNNKQLYRYAHASVGAYNTIFVTIIVEGCLILGAILVHVGIKILSKRVKRDILRRKILSALGPRLMTND